MIIMACLCLVHTVSQLLCVNFCINLAGCLRGWLNLSAGCVCEGVSGRSEYLNWWAEGGRPQRGPALSNLSKVRREPKSLNLFSDSPRWAGNPSVLVLTPSDLE